MDCLLPASTLTHQSYIEDTIEEYPVEDEDHVDLMRSGSDINVAYFPCWNEAQTMREAQRCSFFPLFH